MNRKDLPYPMKEVSDKVIFLKHFIKNPSIIVGDYTYYHHLHHPEEFETENVGNANHQIDGFSTYPFFVFGGDWAEYLANPLRKGDTVVGNDVWFGHESFILPGVTIGDGAIIGARAVVTKDAAPYTIVGGNPARVIRKRFPDDTIKILCALQWWNWDEETIIRNIETIVGCDLEKLIKLSKDLKLS